MMKRTNYLMDEIRQTISPDMRIRMELSVAIANRIYSILERRGMSQKDFARLMGKTETEVSRWLSGTHNLTISTISKITSVLGEDIIVPVASSVSGYHNSFSSNTQYLSDGNSPVYGSSENFAKTSK